jgi:hypothetical protein
MTERGVLGHRRQSVQFTRWNRETADKARGKNAAIGGQQAMPEKKKGLTPERRRIASSTKIEVSDANS